MVVEDEFLVATGLEIALQAAGYCVLGPIPSVEEALKAVAGQHPADLALLDVNLAGHRVYPVADALAARRVPFIFLTGCDGADLPSRFAGTPLLVKPFSPDRLFHTIDQVLGDGSVNMMRPD
jgi:FOG: CheY-like receiver